VSEGLNVCRIHLNDCDSRLWTYVIDNWNNGYTGCMLGLVSRVFAYTTLIY